MKVSIIITTYNSEKFIRRTINSVLLQDRVGIDFKLEIIVIDDNSSDTTCSIIKEEYKTVRLFQNEINSGGPNKGRNLGLSIATGDYINIVDHDDEWLPNKLSEQLKFMSSDNKIVTSNYLLVDSHNQRQEERGNRSETGFIRYKKDETFLNKLAKNKTGEKAYIGSILFHKSLKDVLFEEKYGMVDFDWLLRLFHGNSSVEVNTPLYRRYFYGSNLSLNENYRINDYHYSIYTLESFKNDYPDIIPTSLKRVNGSMARYYYVKNEMILSRYYLIRSEITVKTILYYLTTYVGSSFVKKYFNVFG